MAEWKLIYWYWEKPPTSPFPGRGEYVRLMFEEAGVPYDDVCKNAKNSDEAMAYLKGEKPGFPVFAPPYIQHGDFVMNQTPAIMEYLGKKFNMYPSGGPEEEAHAAQVSLSITDYHLEGNMAFHPVDAHASAIDQVEEAKVTVKAFCEKRLPRFVGLFEKTLKHNNGGSGFIIGDNITYVDIMMLNVLRATEAQFPEEWAAQNVPLLKAFKKRMEERPRVAGYITSDRCIPYTGYSMM